MAVVVVAAVLLSLSDLLLNNLIFADTRPIAGVSGGEDMLFFSPKTLEH